MTVTVSGPVRTVAGVPDRSKWRFSSELRQSGEDGTAIVSTTLHIATPNAAGILTVELDPGLVIIQFGNTTVRATVPDVPSIGLWALISAGVLMPPATPDAKIVAAVEAWLTANPPDPADGTDVTVSRDATSVTVVSSTGADGVVPAADGANAGVMTAAMQTKLAGVADGATANATNAQLRDRSTHTGQQTASTISDFSAAADARISAAAGVSVASLVGGFVPTSQIPAQALTSVQTAANQSAMLALATQEGDVVIRTDEHKSYMRNAGVTGTMADWTLLDSPSDVVTSVNGQAGTVVLGKGDIGLGNVDNTADSAKPVSTAQQNALNLKAPLANPTFTGTVSGVTKAHVGLGSVDNTADTAKAVLSATKLATARTINGVSFDGTANVVLAPQSVAVTNQAAPSIALSAPSAVLTDSGLTAPVTGVTVTGSPADGYRLMLRFKDNGTSRAIALGASFRAMGVTIPAATTVSKWLQLGCVYNGIDAIWDVVAVVVQA